MKLKKLITDIFCASCFSWATGPDCEGCEYRKDPRNHPYAKATTPDELIAAVLMESILNNFDEWELLNAPTYDYYGASSGPTNTSFQKIKDWMEEHGEKVNVVLVNRSKDWFFRYRKIDENLRKDFSFNGEKISTEAGCAVRAAFSKMKKKKNDIEEAARKAEAEAAKIKAEMEAEQRKWNMAENLLGMKRLPNGTLVSKEKYELLMKDSPEIVVEQVEDTSCDFNYFGACACKGKTA